MPDLVSRQYEPKGAGIMSPLPLRPWRARHREKPTGQLPAPGPFPAAQRPTAAVVIFVVILVIVTWLLTLGYSATAALGVVASAGALAATITFRLVNAQPGDG